MISNDNTDAYNFESFARAYSEMLYNYLRKLTGNGEDAEDILQEVLLKIAGGLPDLEDPARIKTWAFRIATNAAIDFFRKHGKNEHILFDESMIGGNEADSDIEDMVIVDEMNECIRREIDRIPPHYRTVLTLHYYEHMTISEISRICDISEATAKIRLHRGKLLLNSILNDSCNFYYDKNCNIRCSSKPGQCKDE